MVNPRVHVVPLLMVALLLAGFSPLRADDRSNLSLILVSRKDPSLSPAAGKSRLDLTDSTSELKMAGLILLRLYQVVLSSQDGPRCMFHPSCSEYAKQALAGRGALIGSLMAVDRYLRCNGVDRDLYPYDPILRKLLDPVLEKTVRKASK